MDNLLNPELCKELRKVINQTDIFAKDKDEKNKYSFICALMDRFDTTVKYVNDNQGRPKDENEMVLFMHHVCIIKDGINYINKILNIDKKDRRIFEKTYRDYPLYLTEEMEYSDDKFFEYFRSLVFAHPFSTSRSIPNSVKGEIQYSPFIMTKRFFETEKMIGAMIYSNKSEEIISLWVPFKDLKKYLKSKYEELTDVIKEFKNIINKKEEIWKKRKVNRNLSNVDILKECGYILKERCMGYYEVEDAINSLICESNIKENENSVSMYRNAIIEIIPQICDAIDAYDHEKAYGYLNGVLCASPKGYDRLGYQREKIFTYLNYGNTSENIDWGLIQAEEFAEGFAKKWVIIKPGEMSFEEIKMLVRTACYLEYIKQKEG